MRELQAQGHTLTVVVMAKPAIPGRVKTRLIGDPRARGGAGGLTAKQAAAVHGAMLACVLERAEIWLPDARRVMALAGPPPDPRRPADSSAGLDDIIIKPAGGSAPAPPDPPDAPDAPAESWEVIGQGDGDLGQRLLHVWENVGGGGVAFLGVDSPDVPGEALRRTGEALRDSGCDAAVGPTLDGGYWTLVGRELNAALLSGIDWGTAAVYDQTCAAAARAGLRLQELPRWDDVDTPRDLAALRARLEVAAEPPLIRLRDRLRAILEDRTP